VHVNIPFLEAPKEAPSNLKFLRELLSKKGKLEKVNMIPIREMCSTVIQNKLPSSLQDPGSFTIGCAIGHPMIEGALCDLGAIVCLMPLFLDRKP